MATILRRAANYKRVSNILYEGRAHLTDPYTPAPIILKVLNFIYNYIEM